MLYPLCHLAQVTKKVTRAYVDSLDAGEPAHTRSLIVTNALHYINIYQNIHFGRIVKAGPVTYCNNECEASIDDIHLEHVQLKKLSTASSFMLLYVVFIQKGLQGDICASELLRGQHI